MKLLRFGEIGHETPGLLDEAGVIRNLAGVIPDLGPDQLHPDQLRRIAAIRPDSLPAVEGTPRLGAPVANPGKFIAIGLNYADHAAEAGLPVPSEPIFFSKAISCVGGPNDPIMVPRDSTKLDWEVELGVIIGRKCRYVPAEEALGHIAGFVLANDVSERNFQTERGSQWDKGKGCDTFGPLGPWLVTPDEIADCQALDLYLDVNGQRRQTGNTATMIFPVAECIAYVSRFMTLLPGDILITGTPPGVGSGIKPTPVFLKAGDKIRLRIPGLGEQNQTVVPFAL